MPTNIQPSNEDVQIRDKHKGRCELGIAELFQEQVSANGATIAIESVGHALSYAELHLEALHLAAQIRALALSDNSGIAMLIPRGINHILAQLAIIYSGRPCIPLDTKLSDDFLKSMLSSLKSTCFITDRENAHRLANFTHLVADHKVDDKGQLPGPGSFVSASRGSSTCSHIFHTSGTSGKPKAVELLAGGLVNLCCNPHANWIKRGQRVGHAASVVFDISLVEIWGSLLNGATIVVIPEETLLDPLELSRFIRNRRLDVLQLTTSLLDVTAYACPWAFSTLDTLITGGEAINCHSIRSIYNSGSPRRIINGYGPTEGSVYCLWHCVSRVEAIKGRIPVGKPFTNVEVFLVSEDLTPVGVNEVGELLVSGAGVAGGYIGEREKTAKSFIHLPQLSRNSSQRTKPSSRMYRTGDLMRRDKHGVHYYIGRRDNQVKIGGQRIELETIESILQETRLVSAASVIKVTPQEAGRSALLVAFCVPISPDVTTAAVTDAYIRQEPCLLVPRLELTEMLPLKSNGKVDRDKLERQYTGRIESSLARRINPADGQAGSVEDELKYLWLDVLGLPDRDLQPTDDFIAVGGNSIMVATLIARIKHTFDISLRASMLYEKMTLGSLTHLLTTLQQEEKADLLIQANEQEVWLHDSQLGQQLRPLNELSVLDWQAASERRVFVTGVTGFVGAFFFAELLREPTVEKVACLVRCHDEAHGRLRLQQVLLKYQLHPPHMDKLIVVPGCFGEDKLGLSDEQYDYYAEWASVVFHLGAKVNYLASYSAHRKDNVLGTVNILKFAAHKRTKPTHYTSTIAVYGPTGFVTDTNFLHEDTRPVSHIAALSYDTGYAQSQLVAETIAWNAIDNGLPITIYRPGFVLGHSQTGVCNPDDFISRLFASCMELGSYPLLLSQRKEFVPVDFVAKTLLHISKQQGKNVGHAFNLVHPDPKSAIDICASFALLNRISPFSMQGVPYARWVQSLSMRPEDPLYPLVPMLRERVLGERTRWEVYEGMAVYGRDNLHRALRGAPDIRDSIDMGQLFERCLKSWIAPVNRNRLYALPTDHGELPEGK
ncbi:non-ribosomal peptide synthetase [Aspergillus foveolatus]|uniref:non-ribosomal peptide synthetase n=1 Tax=Aspergillus foveolatus TaxID=210207 RepID=UPI003CCD2BAD